MHLEFKQYNKKKIIKTMEDKLITLENLDAFLDNVIADSSVASKCTWSSEKINSMLAALEARIAALENPTTVE